MKDKECKKRGSLQPLALTFLEQLQIHLCDLLQHLLHLIERTQTRLYFFFHLAGNRDLPHLAIAETDGENPNRPVAFALTLLAKPAHRVYCSAPCDSIRNPARRLKDRAFAGGVACGQR